MLILQSTLIRRKDGTVDGRMGMMHGSGKCVYYIHTLNCRLDGHVGPEMNQSRGRHKCPSGAASVVHEVKPLSGTLTRCMDTHWSPCCSILPTHLGKKC